jgi:hypothetical protein
MSDASKEGGSFADVIRQLNDGTLRIGLHVQGIDEDDANDSFVNVPAPGAGPLGSRDSAWLAGSGAVCHSLC